MGGTARVHRAVDVYSSRFDGGRFSPAVRSPGAPFAPGPLPRAWKNAPSASPLATRGGSPPHRGRQAAGAFYPIASRPLTRARTEQRPVFSRAGPMVCATRSRTGWRDGESTQSGRRIQLRFRRRAFFTGCEITRAPFAPGPLPRAWKNAPSASPVATRGGSPPHRGRQAAGAFYPMASRPLTRARTEQLPRFSRARPMACPTRSRTGWGDGESTQSGRRIQLSFRRRAFFTGCEITRGAVSAGPATAGVEKRAFRIARRDPRRVPNPPRSSGCRRVLPDRVTPAHAGPDRTAPQVLASTADGLARSHVARDGSRGTHDQRSSCASCFGP
jgi:hypothetical protein